MIGQPVVHGAGPEAALAVALAFIEAGRRDVGLGLGDPVDGAGIEVVEGDAGGEGDDQPAILAQGEAGDALRHLPAVDLAGGGHEALEEPAFDIDPVERLLGHVPNRHLAQPVAGVDDAFDGHAGILPTPVDATRSSPRQRAGDLILPDRFITSGSLAPLTFDPPP